jgi:hypothetical protein
MQIIASTKSNSMYRSLPELQNGVHQMEWDIITIEPIFQYVHFQNYKHQDASQLVQHEHCLDKASLVKQQHEKLLLRS